MQEPQKPVGIFFLLIVLIIVFLGYLTIKMLEPRQKSSIGSPELISREELWGKINQKLEQARVLREKDNHLQAAILLSEIAAVQSVLEDELGLTGSNEPTFNEALARRRSGSVQ